MNIKIFTLKFNTLIAGFDDTEVRTFIADKEVQTIHDHAFIHQGIPHLSLVVSYHSNINSHEKSLPTVKNHASESHADDWRKRLTEAEIPLFNTFREWRSSKSKEEGVPTYFVCTNNQLADIVHARPNSMAALDKIDGFGAGRLKKYGQEILAILGKKAGTESTQLGTEEKKIMPTPEESPNETSPE